MKLKRILKVLFSFGIFGISCVLAIQIVMINSTKSRIISLEQVKELDDIDCILVLGAGIDNNNKPSLMLKERLDTSIDIYNLNITNKIIMSGDHIRDNHDEVNVMKKYAIDNNDIPSSNIFMDHAGISTYDSVYRAKNIFGVKKMIIVTQEYHLYRALYIAECLGIEAYGVNATKKIYARQEMRDFREVLARTKDFLKTIIKPKSTFLGDKISLENSGDITNDLNDLESNDMEIYLKINDKVLSATLVSNSSTEELIKKLQDNDIVVNMHDYGNFEKVGALGFNIPRNDEYIITVPGDIILYEGNQITIYYDENSWNFTKLGRIDDISKQNLKQILGKGDVTVTISLSK